MEAQEDQHTWFLWLDPLVLPLFQQLFLCFRVERLSLFQGWLSIRRHFLLFLSVPCFLSSSVRIYFGLGWEVRLFLDFISEISLARPQNSHQTGPLTVTVFEGFHSPGSGLYVTPTSRFQRLKIHTYHSSGRTSGTSFLN